MLQIKNLVLITTVVGVCGFLASACGPGADKLPPIDLTKAASPVASDFSSENDLSSSYASMILPAYQSGTGGTFTGQAGVMINYRIFKVPNEKGAIVLQPGRTEPIYKYAETIFDLNNQGYSVYAMDERGQGGSGRMLPDKEKGYVDYFSFYIKDLDTFVNTIVKSEPHPHLFAVAHSMGAAITIMYLDAHPGVFEAVVLSSPMISIDTAPFPPAVTIDIAATDCGFSDGSSFAVGQADYNPNVSFSSSSDNNVTHSLERWNLKLKMFNDHPELRLGGATYHWLCESVIAGDHMLKLGANSVTPTLIFEAGQDTVVNVSGEQTYCGAAARCQWEFYSGAYHEFFSEIDSIRNDALMKGVRFLDHFAAGGQ